MNPLKPASNLYKSLEVNRTILALSIARLGDAMANSILFVVIPLEVAEFPNSGSYLPLSLMVGVLISAYGLANAGLQPFTAALSDRIGHYKFILQSGLILVGMTTLTLLFADRYLHLFVLRIIQGFGVALQIPPTMALLAMMTRQQTRGGSMGFYTTMRMLGYVLGPLLGGLIYRYLGLNAAFIAGTMIMLLAVLVVQFYVEDMPAAGVAAGRRFRIIDPVLLTPSIVNAGLAAFLMGSAFIMITSLENEFNSRLNISAFGFGIAFSFLMIGRLLFQVPMGRFSDRFGRKPFVFCGLLL